MHLSEEAKNEIRWWIDNILTAKQIINHIPPIDQVIYCDASELGWGAHFPKGNQTAQGRWTQEDAGKHINQLEMIAAKFAIKSLVTTGTKHIRVMSDNTTCISYINKMGGSKSPECNNIAVEIWKQAKSQNYWISAAHIPGIHNKVADKASRVFSDATEWKLRESIFNLLTHRYGTPSIDIFASYQNHQLSRYAAWHPDPEACAIDGLALPWNNELPYLYPPHSLIWPSLRKIQNEQTTAILIAPLWPTQTWFTTILRMATDFPTIIPSKHIYLPGTQKTHPLYPKLKLLATKVSGNSTASEAFRMKALKSSNRRDAREPRTTTRASSANGWIFVVKGKLLPLEHL
jgi:ribonuclease HI